jgi:hypothetical protein
MGFSWVDNDLCTVSEKTHCNGNKPSNSKGIERKLKVTYQKTGVRPHQARGKRGSPPISRVLSWATIPLGPPLPTGSSSLPGSGASSAIASLFGLAPDGGYRAIRVATNAVVSYTAVSPLPDPRPPEGGAPINEENGSSNDGDPVASRRQDPAIGGLLSVALFVASRRPAVSRHPALWGPDFPP